MLEVKSPVKSAKLDAFVTVGPETAKRLGVPVGSVIDLGTLAQFQADSQEN